MVTALNVDLGGSQASAASIKGVVGEMHTIVGRIRAAAVNGGGGWDGRASRAFEGAHTDWHATATRLENALDEIERKLTAGLRGYETDDVEAAAQVGASANATLTF